MRTAKEEQHDEFPGTYLSHSHCNIEWRSLDSSGDRIRQNTRTDQARRLRQFAGQPFAQLGKPRQQGTFECRRKFCPIRRDRSGCPRSKLLDGFDAGVGGRILLFRLAHAIVFNLGLSRLMIRTVIFTVSNVAMLVYGVLVLMHLF